ncbi:zinc metalloprotease HtpX [Picrophilus oshimae]|uniref:Protease HtpX homolog n=1 Tax=Picrophilus torridus (strain ATCC 700027 / DSM 9790 / JCM 10055 / NBRC 100828 / KAW 2/3) TaxID=1122961 RepID=A0A8G2FY27_PICTO|nr:zinc metalloprotease HtpX [Picrophilus oshimae]SMD31533.1 Heat shock protein. Metallo peptidase. MEROPS family M48B [Picrophilus oshimae DSM 9789]
MDLYSIKLKVITILAGIGIALLFSLIAYGLLYYFYGLSGISIIYFLLIFVLFIDIIQWLVSPYIIGMTYRLQKVSPMSQYGYLIDIVHDAAEKNNIKEPEVYIAMRGSPNAFAYSSPLAGKRIAFTKSILDILNRDELEAVAGHELGHLKHHDVELLLAIGLIPTLIFYLGYSMIFSGFGRRNGGSFFLVAILLFILSSVFNIMILGVNRIRESYADVNSAMTIPNGAENLQNALAKIYSYSMPSKQTSNSTVNMLMFSDHIENDLGRDYRKLVEKWKNMKPPVSIFSDHPHPAKRIQILERYKNSF